MRRMRATRWVSINGVARNGEGVDVTARVKTMDAFNPGDDAQRRKTRGEQLFSERASSDSPNGFTRRRAPATLPCANTKLRIITEISVTRAVNMVPIAIAGRTLILIAYDQTDGRAEGASAVEIKTRKHLNEVVFIARRYQFRLPRTSTCQEGLNRDEI